MVKKNDNNSQGSERRKQKEKNDKKNSIYNNKDNIEKTRYT